MRIEFTNGMIVEDCTKYSQTDLNIILCNQFEQDAEICFHEIPITLWDDEGFISDDFDLYVSLFDEGYLDNDVLDAYIKEFGSLDKSIKDAYHGYYASDSDYVELYVLSNYELPSFLVRYIDLDALYSDLEVRSCDGHYFGVM